MHMHHTRSIFIKTPHALHDLHPPGRTTCTRPPGRTLKLSIFFEVRAWSVARSCGPLTRRRLGSVMLL